MEEQSNEYLVFRLGESSYAVPIQSVSKVVQVKHLQETAHGSRALLGMTEVLWEDKLQSLPLLNLKEYLGSEKEPELHAKSLALVVEKESGPIALLVDELQRAIEVNDPDEIGDLDGEIHPYISSKIQHEDQLIFSLKMRSLLGAIEIHCDQNQDPDERKAG